MALNAERTSGDGVLSVDWGDGSGEERFDHDAERPQSYKHIYQFGQYNGLVSFLQDNCEITRYFSVDATRTSSIDSNYALVLFLILLILPFSYWSYIRGRVLMKTEMKKFAEENKKDPNK